jgi:pectin methylesterase-like acyl-CoA thioesterase
VTSPTIITVGASGADYTTIQAAIDAASPGDTISVGAGTYSERLAIGKAVTINGAGAADTTINGAEAPGWL